MWWWCSGFSLKRPSGKIFSLHKLLLQVFFHVCGGLLPSLVLVQTFLFCTPLLLFLVLSAGNGATVRFGSLVLHLLHDVVISRLVVAVGVGHQLAPQWIGSPAKA